LKKKYQVDLSVKLGLGNYQLSKKKRFGKLSPALLPGDLGYSQQVRVPVSRGLEQRFQQSETAKQ
jgi:hypothetical protein